MDTDEGYLRSGAFALPHVLLLAQDDACYDLVQGEEVDIGSLELQELATSPPGYLTESDLISLMVVTWLILLGRAYICDH